MRLITFDGLSGSGKYTQSNHLCDHFGIEWVQDDCLNTMMHVAERVIGDKDLIGRMTLWIAAVRLSYQFDWHKRDLFTMNSFWRFVIETFTWGDFDNVDVLLDAVDTLLIEDRNDILPVCSFYLDISGYESSVRFIKREAQWSGLSGSPSDIKIEGLGENPEIIERDNRLIKITNHLADRYPFFHVIDGMRSEQEVFDDILRISEEALSQ